MKYSFMDILCAVGTIACFAAIGAMLALGV